MAIFALHSNRVQSSEIMAAMRTLDSSMKIHDRNLHVLLTMEAFCTSVITYAFQLKPIKSFCRIRQEL